MIYHRPFLRRIGWPHKQVRQEPILESAEEGKVVLCFIEPYNLKEFISWLKLRIRLWPLQREINRSWKTDRSKQSFLRFYRG